MHLNYNSLQYIQVTLREMAAAAADRNDPLSILLVVAGSRGYRLLFRYPYEEVISTDENDSGPTFTAVRNPFGIDRSFKNVHKQSSNSILKDGNLFGYPDDILANILVPGSNLCEAHFELKIDEALFVGHPVLVEKKNEFSVEKTDDAHIKDDVQLKIFNIVIVVKTECDQSAIKCYQVLCKILANAIRHEENRTRYLTKERGLIAAIQDEVVGQMPEDCHQSPFEIILSKSKLAQDLKLIFEELCDSGIINVYVNKWINVSFCLPHRVHRNEEGRLRIEPDLLTDYASRIRPYHTVLLLDEERNLLSKLPDDCAPTLKRIIKMCSVIKSFQTLSQDADISLSQIFSVVSHLVYWGKAMVIYPLAESNVYVISKSTPTNIDSKVADKFEREFQRKSHLDLISVLARFSFPTTLAECKNPVDSIHKQREHVNIVVWLLKQQLLKQLHTYVYFMPPDDVVDKSAMQEFSSLEFDDLDEPENTSKDMWASVSKKERMCILKMQPTVDPEDITFFLRILPYFKGQHHLEEIMYYENLRRSELVTLIDKFRSLLITTQHEDPATAYRA